MYASIDGRLGQYSPLLLWLPKEGWVSEYFSEYFFFTLKYRRQLKWRQQIMGPKVVIASAANFSFLAEPLAELWNLVKMKPVNFGSLEYCGIFISLSPNIGALGRPNVKDLQSHKRVLAPPLLVCFLTAMNKKRIKYLKAWRFLGHSLVSSCFQFSQKFCDLVAKKKWEAMVCVYAIGELR